MALELERTSEISEFNLCFLEEDGILTLPSHLPRHVSSNSLPGSLLSLYHPLPLACCALARTGLLSPACLHTLVFWLPRTGEECQGEFQA